MLIVVLATEFCGNLLCNDRENVRRAQWPSEQRGSTAQVRPARWPGHGKAGPQGEEGGLKPKGPGALRRCKQRRGPVRFHQGSSGHGVGWIGEGGTRGQGEGAVKMVLQHPGGRPGGLPGAWQCRWRKEDQREI